MRTKGNRSLLLEPLRDFAEAVQAKTNTPTAGEPEDQLRAPFENFMNAVGRTLGWNVICKGQVPLRGRLGKPDFAIHLNHLLAGYAELKAPGVGADPKRFTGHNRKQWERFKSIPNILYTDGNEWAVYRRGKPLRELIRLSGDVTTDGRKAVKPKDAEALEALLRDFLTWKPVLPLDRKGRLDINQFVKELAAYCRMLRQDVADALKDPKSPLFQLAKDWRKLLFPDASDEQFADAYAQTVTFALLLARSLGADPLSLETAEASLASDHSLLSRALRVLTDPQVQEEISASLDLLLRVVDAVPPDALSGPEDPWLHFYEEFLAAYDPKLRKDVGAYYTPVEVVQAQVRLIDSVLTDPKRLGKGLGFADPSVVTLDPAVGTGTYLLGVIEHALKRVEEIEGAGAVPARATALAENLYGFEIMVGPFAVCELRVSRALQDKGAKLPKGGPHIYLTDTLESPSAEPLQLPLFLKPIADQHAKALQVKREVPVIVCLGNPPYDRHETAKESDKARTGGWVRWGDDGEGQNAILKDFLKPAIAAGRGVHVKNLYNKYVYFWRWALWKVFESETSAGPGVVSFISASSYLDGDAFCGMREHMRRLCDEIWILDLGGEGRGPRKSENVFAIRTPVAIAVAARYRKKSQDKPARVYYARIEGSRKEKLRALAAIVGLESLIWEECPTEWQAPFRPAGRGLYFAWPLLRDLFPWQHPGAQFKRTWPIAPDPETLKRRWTKLLEEKENRATLFKETRDRKVDLRYPPLPGQEEAEPISKLEKESAPLPPILRYAYRSFDRQWILADNRLGDFLRPELWAAHSNKQVYVTTLLNHPLGAGPALTAAADIPDLHHFRGSYGAKEIIPLYRDSQCTNPNVLPGLLDLLAQTYGQDVSPEDFLAYVYGILAQPAFTKRFSKELETRELRVPLTKDPELFRKVRDVGAKLLWLHTYGERYVPQGFARGAIPQGKARCVKPVPDDSEKYPERFRYSDTTQTLHVGDGEFRPVAPEVYEFEVSGLKVVQSWLGYRMKNPKGKKSSPLDDIRPERWTATFTTDLLRLLWVLEATLDTYPEQEQLLEEVLRGPLFTADELPPVPESARKPPPLPRRGRGKSSQSKEDKLL